MYRFRWCKRKYLRMDSFLKYVSLTLLMSLREKNEIWIFWRSISNEIHFFLVFHIAHRCLYPSSTLSVFPYIHTYIHSFWHILPLWIFILCGFWKSNLDLIDPQFLSSIWQTKKVFLSPIYVIEDVLSETKQSVIESVAYVSAVQSKRPIGLV